MWLRQQYFESHDHKNACCHSSFYAEDSMHGKISQILTYIVLQCVILILKFSCFSIFMLCCLKQLWIIISCHPYPQVFCFNLSSKLASYCKITCSISHISWPYFCKIPIHTVLLTLFGGRMILPSDFSKISPWKVEKASVKLKPDYDPHSLLFSY